METIGISKLDLKRQNRMQILRLLRNNGPISRIDIAHTIHITKAAVTIITNEMISEGIIHEIGEQAPIDGKVSRGRKKILVALNPTWKLILGISLQGGWLNVGLCTMTGGIVEHHSVETDLQGDADTLLSTIASFCSDLLYKNALKPEGLLGIGLCIDAPYYPLCGITEENGSIDTADFEKKLLEATGLTDTPITVGSLTDGISMGETCFRKDAVPAASDQVVLQLGGSFGSTVTFGQEIYRGANGKAAAIGNLLLGEGKDRTSAAKRLSRRTISDQLRSFREQKLCPALDSASMDNPQRAEWLFCRAGFVPEDTAVRQYFESVKEDYITLLTGVLIFFDPQQLILFPDNCVTEALIQAIKTVSGRFSDDHSRILVSSFDETDLFLAGAALALESCFIRKGGYR